MERETESEREREDRNVGEGRRKVLREMTGKKE